MITWDRATPTFRSISRITATTYGFELPENHCRHRTGPQCKGPVVVDSSSACDFLGVSFRRLQSGPEQELVANFIRDTTFDLSPELGATVFREPRLDSGFPDVVIVLWNRAVARHWNHRRTTLKPVDVRLIHYLSQTGPAEDQYIRSVFPRSIAASLARLEAAEMLNFAANKWLTRPLDQIFAVRRITAIEAKVGEWQAALHQAHLNTWFASDSHVLLPRLPRGSSLLEAATEMGIGVWTLEDGTSPIALSAVYASLPRSYCSWLFNEWAWRASLQHDACL